MHLKRIALHDFRIYHDQVISFGEGINIICGGNGQGKTSLLEAVYLLVAGRSFRTTRVKDLIRQDGAFFALEADFVKQGVQQRLSMVCDGKEKKITHNATTYRSVLEMLGLLLGVVMSSDDIALINGAPQVRRRFLDMHIAQVDPLYVHHLMRYYRALKQRNCLLRTGHMATLEMWEQQMARSAGYIAVQRVAAIADLSSQAMPLYQNVTGDRCSMALEYRWGVFGANGPVNDVEAACNYYLEQWERHRHREQQAKCSLIGPHRDEIMITIDGHQARYFASEGQQRCSIAALRMSEWERLKTKTQEIPLMMIDDLSTGLDNERRKRLHQQAATLGQVFLTSVDMAVYGALDSVANTCVIELEDMPRSFFRNPSM